MEEHIRNDRKKAAIVHSAVAEKLLASTAHSGFFPPIFVSLNHIERSRHASQNWYFSGANWYLGIKTDQNYKRNHKKNQFWCPNIRNIWKIPVLRCMPRTFNVFWWNKNWGKIHCAVIRTGKRKKLEKTIHKMTHVLSWCVENLATLSTVF